MAGPHDALFKQVFSAPENAASELRAILPAAISSRLDWSSLTPEPASFVDAHLSGRHADLLFSVRCDGRDAFLYVLLEHQSQPDSLMAFRLLQYVVRIWDAFLREQPNARLLPAVLPLVVHHSGSRWTAATELTALIDLDAEMLGHCGMLVPRFQYLLDDLAVIDEASLRARTLTAAAMAALALLQQARTSPDLIALFRRWRDIIARVIAGPNGVAALSALLEYASRVGEVQAEDFRQFIHELGPQAEEAYVTIAQQLTEEALARGKAEGRAEGKAELVIRLLTSRFGTLPEHVSNRVRHSDPDLLDQWAERVLTATKLDEVFR